MTHAMVISGVHLDATGKPIRYKVENSWGSDSGDKGYFVMTDKWFEEFVYQVVVPKQLADKKLLSVYENGQRIVLPPWDPMVSFFTSFFFGFAYLRDLYIRALLLRCGITHPYLYYLYK